MRGEYGIGLLTFSSRFKRSIEAWIYPSPTNISITIIPRIFLKLRSDGEIYEDVDIDNIDRNATWYYFKYLPDIIKRKKNALLLRNKFQQSLFFNNVRI